MATNLGAFVRGTYKAIKQNLAILAAISGYASFQGLSQSEALNGGNFLDHAETTIFAIGTSIAIYLFWSVLYSILPNIQTLKARMITLAVAVMIGCPIIIASSSHPNAAGIAGKAALHSEINYKIKEFEVATAKQYQTTTQLAGLSTDVSVLLDKFKASTRAEFQSGKYSGKAGPGAVYNALSSITNKLKILNEALSNYEVNSKANIVQAQSYLRDMRNMASINLPPQERMDKASTIADRLRITLLNMDAKPVSGSLSRVLEALPKEISVVSARLSDKPSVAKAQKTALNRLNNEVTQATVRLSKISAEFSKLQTISIPILEPMTPMAAVAKHWRDFTTVWAIGLLIDLAPFFPLLFIVIAVSERTIQEVSHAKLMSITVEEMLYAKLAETLMKGAQLDDALEKSLIDKTLGREDN